MGRTLASAGLRLLLLWGLLQAGPGSMGHAAAAGLNVEVSVRQTPYFVGQAVELRVGVVATNERPRILPPTLAAGGEIRLIREEFRQVTSSGIGDQISEQNLYISRFRLIPKAPGTLKLGGFRAELGERTGVSRPVTLTIRPLPAARPAGFLGGVGPLSLQADAEPSTLRMGQDLEFRLKLIGPGSRNSVDPLDVSRLAGLGFQLRDERPQIDSVEDPPSRTLRYRLRAVKSGEFRIPSFLVASFDPASERYFTVSSTSLPIRVVDVPRFDPGSLPTKPAPKADATKHQGRIWLLTVLSLLAGGIGLYWLRRKRMRRPTAAGWYREARRKLEQADDADLPVAIAHTVRSFFELWKLTPGGEITPTEAEECFVTSFARPDLAASLRTLLEACDQNRFSTEKGSAGLRASALGLFGSLAILEPDPARSEERTLG